MSPRKQGSWMTARRQREGEMALGWLPQDGSGFEAASMCQRLTCRAPAQGSLRTRMPATSSRTPGAQFREAMVTGLVARRREVLRTGRAGRNFWTPAVGQGDCRPAPQEGSQCEGNQRRGATTSTQWSSG